MIKLWILLFLVSITNGLQYVRRNLFTADHAESWRTAIEINIQLPGKIYWKSDSSNSLHFHVTSRATEPQELDRVKVTFEETRDRIVLTVDSASEPRFEAHNSGAAAALAWITSPLVLTLGLIGGFIPSLSNGRHFSILALFLIWFVHDPGGYFAQSRLLVDKDAQITVRVPRGFVFTSVELFVADGDISVDPTLMRTTAPVHCSTISSDTLSCPNCCSGRGVCSERHLCECQEGYDGQACELQAEPEYTVFVNPADTRLMSTQSTTGDTIDVYGKRTANGSVKSINILKRRDLYGRQTTVKLGKRYRVRKIRSSTGSRLDLKWRGKNRVYVTAVTPNGRSQVNVDVRMGKNRLVHNRHHHNVSSAKHRRSFLRKRRDVQNEIDISKLIENAEIKSIPLTNFRSQYLHIPVSVTSCGVPEPHAEVYAEVYMNYHNGSWDGSVEYRALPTGDPGMFYIQIPNNPASRAKDSLAKACASIESAALKSCSIAVSRLQEYQDKICNATERAFNFVQNSDTGQVEDVVSTCKSGFQAVSSHCRTLDFSPLGMKEQESACSRVKRFEDSYTDKPIYVSPVVIYPDGRMLHGDGKEIKITRNMVYHEDAFVLNDSDIGTKLSDVIIVPNDPKPKERYQVRINHRCASDGTAVYASIVGSDRYQHEIECYGRATCDCCVLDVAGAAKLVVDSVEINLVDPNLSAPLARQVIVVF